MNFNIITKQIKTREVLEAQEDLGAAINMMSRFMVDDAGEPIPQEQAREILLDLDLDEQAEVQEDFLAAFTRQAKKRRGS